MAEEKRFLRLPEVLKRTALSRTSIWRMMKRNEFPRNVRLGARAVAWRESDVEKWMDTRPPTKPRKKTASRPE